MRRLGSGRLQIRRRNCSRSHGSAFGCCCAARPPAAPSDVRRTASARMHKRGHRDTEAVAGRRFADGDRANSLPCSHEHKEPLRSKRWCQRPCDRRHLGPGSGCLPSRRAPLIERRPRPLMRRPPEGGRERDVGSSMRRPGGVESVSALYGPPASQAVDARLRIEAHLLPVASGTVERPAFPDCLEFVLETNGLGDCPPRSWRQVECCRALGGLHPARVGSFFKPSDVAHARCAIGALRSVGAQPSYGGRTTASGGAVL